MKKNFENKTSKIKYEKPIIVKEEELNIAKNSLKKLSVKYFCRQCSSCHGCR